MSLADTSPASKVISAYNELSVKPKYLHKEEAPLDISSASLPAKDTVSPNHFSMRGPWLEHALAFHSMKTEGSSLIGTADRFEFQSRTPIEDAIKIVTACSSQTNLDNFLYTKKGRHARKRKNASVKVNSENMIPTPVPERRTIASTSAEKPPIGKRN